MKNLITILFLILGISAFSQNISVISPNGGETLTINQTYEIVWNASNLYPYSITINHNSSNGVIPDNVVINYVLVTTVNSSKIMIDKNLGATTLPSSVDDTTNSSVGYYWQFNTKQGHSMNVNWISDITENSNWQIQNDPCACELGNGWRIPTSDEWLLEIYDNGWHNWYGPFNSNLKLHAGGLILPEGGFYQSGISGRYWSSDQYDNQYGKYLDFYELECSIYENLKTSGFAVRCIKEVNVKIEYSIDGGSQWNLIADNVPYNFNSYMWVVPDVVSETCLIRITSQYDGITFDVSNNTFSIQTEQRITAAKNLTSKDVLISPNPVNESTLISFNNMPSNKMVRIVNMSGQIVKEFNTTENIISVDFSDISKGSYFMQIYSANGLGVIKIVK